MYRSTKISFITAALLLTSAQILAQEVEVEEMICRDMGDIFCTLDEFSESITPDAQGLTAKPGPVPSERVKSRLNPSVIDLQDARTESVLNLSGQAGKPAEVRLINLNPDVNTWHLLKLTWNPQRIEWFHLENGLGQNLNVELSSNYNNGLVLTNANGEKQQCDL
ncbi:MAG: hypothetical protein EOP10_12920, partial [Proteobacteria bacterium]